MRFKAFTLAEVLITLGVIGVVAALTLPTLMTNYKKKQTLERLKSSYSILNNALERAKADYGLNVNEWTVPTSSDRTVVADYFCDHYIMPYVKIIKDCNDTEDRSCTIEYSLLNGEKVTLNSNNRTFVLSNGVIVSAEVFNNAGSSGNYRAIFTLIINGNKKTNIMGHDVFRIELGGYSKTKNGHIHDKNRFLPYYYSPVFPAERYRENASDDSTCSYGNKGEECFAYIMASGWKFPDDYPW